MPCVYVSTGLGASSEVDGDEYRPVTACESETGSNFKETENQMMREMAQMHQAEKVQEFGRAARMHNNMAAILNPLTNEKTGPANQAL